jgi:serine phosphatase RsbU (regulator of sigma subunit)
MSSENEDYLESRNPIPSHTLQCMEIIGGNHAAEREVTAPGLDIWVSSRPSEGTSGGDVHYFSMCGSGRVTRLIVADVSGHGPTVSDVADALRELMRKHINLLDQTKLARAINREFMERPREDHFATFVLLTYFAPTKHLLVCNGGHPPPLWFSTELQRWQLLDKDTPHKGPSIREETYRYMMRPVSNLPLGIIEPTSYCQFSVKLCEGDVIVAYTDALTDVHKPEGLRLGELGLLKLATHVQVSEPRNVTASVLDRVDRWSENNVPDDDRTLIVMRHNASEPPEMTVRQAIRSMAKMVGLSK